MGNGKEELRIYDEYPVESYSGGDMTANKEKIVDLCFICLQVPDSEDNLDLSTIYDEEYNLTYAECFTICTKIELKANDNLPQNLCKSCGLELQMSYDFYKKVEETKRYLQECYNIHIKYCDDYEGNGSTTKQTDGTVSATTQPSESLLTNTSQFGIEADQGQQIEHLDKVVDFDGRILENFSTTDGEEQLVRTAEQDETGGIIEADTEDDCLILEEHLEADDFNNLEALGEETADGSESAEIKLSRNSIPMEYYQIETDNKYACIDNDPNDADSHTCAAEEKRESLQKVQNKKNSRSWQDNVVTVANKEHLPLETENLDGDNSDVEYEVILTATEDDISDATTDHEKLKEASGGEKPGRKRHSGMYSCDYCLKVYPNYSRMMTHRRTHLTDKPKYPCSYCNRIYATKQAMECHVQTAHDKTGYTCTICGKIFAIRRSLEVHMRFHLGDFPYACNLCDRKFAHLGHLNTHKNVKHNNVRFSCDYPNCGKFFTSSASLRNHEFTHGNMPFECKHCHRGYPCKSKLRVHIKRKHGHDPTSEEMESMRKFQVMRSKLNLVQVVTIEQKA